MDAAQPRFRRCPLERFRQQVPREQARGEQVLRQQVPPQQVPRQQARPRQGDAEPAAAVPLQVAVAEPHRADAVERPQQVQPVAAVVAEVEALRL